MPLSLFSREKTDIALYSEDEAVSFLVLQQLLCREKQSFIGFPAIPVEGLEAAIRNAVRTLVQEGCAFPWKRLAQGANARVFELPCGNVLRMSFHGKDGTFYFHQRCAMLWEEGLACTWMPKVHFTLCLENFLYISVLEKVITLPDNDSPELWTNLPKGLQGDAFWDKLTISFEDKEVEDLKGVLCSDKTTSYKVLYLASMCLNLADLSFLEAQIDDDLTEELKDSLAEFVEIFRALFEFFDKRCMPQIFDCWHHNMGIRPGSLDLVLLDPLCPK